MHATYAFLMSMEEIGVELRKGSAILDAIIQSQEDYETAAAEAAVNWFENEYANGNTDENNWYQPMALILADGMVINTAESGDWRSRDTWATSFENEHPDPKTRLAEALRLGLLFVACEMRLHKDIPVITIGQPSDAEQKAIDKVDSMSVDELDEAIRNVIPKRLSKAYKSAVGKRTRERLDMEQYQRDKTARSFEIYVNSVVPGFAEYPERPNRYRCFDLRHNQIEDVSNVCVLFVDIHT